MLSTVRGHLARFRKARGGVALKKVRDVSPALKKVRERPVRI